MSLQDPNLLTAFKIQVHIAGAKQVFSGGIEATLHYQMAYRIQDHAFDMQIPGGSEALILVADQDRNITCTHVPHKCTKEELLQVIPDTWVTNYEKQHTERQPIESHETKMKRRTGGTVGFSFDHSHVRRTDFLLTTNLLHLLGEDEFDRITQEPHWEEYRVYDEDNDEDHVLGYVRNGGSPPWEIVKSWDTHGAPIYWFKDPISNHCFFDLCDEVDCTQCNPVPEEPARKT